MSKVDLESTLPIPVKRAVRKLGRDIRDARRRRRVPVALQAERAGMSRSTLNRIEKGDVGVSMGYYASALMALGLLDHIALLADPGRDAVGRALEEEYLPQRIRLRRKGRQG